MSNTLETLFRTYSYASAELDKRKRELDEDFFRQLLKKVANISPETDTQTEQADKILNLKEAAEFLQISPQTLRTRCRKNDVPYIQVGSRYRFSLLQLKDYAQGKWKNPIEEIANQYIMNKK